MKMCKSTEVKLKWILFAIIPFIYTIIAISIHFLSGKSFMQRVDPEYLHLFNGINIAIGNLAVEYIAHPGTTIQIIYALSAHIVNIFLPGSDLVSKVLDDPETFIHAANMLINMITGLSLFAVAYFTYKYTTNIFAAVFLQLIPFANYHLILISARIIPETVLVAPALLLLIFCIKYLNDDKPYEKTKYYLLSFAIIGGLGMAGKFSYLPFLLPPVFLFPDWKTRGKYISFTIIATLILAFPLVVNLAKSWDWFSSMLIHSGRWGSGGSTIIDISSFPGNVVKLIKLDNVLAIISVVAILQLIVFFILKYLKLIQYNSLIARLLFAFVLVYVLAILLVSKHFAFHYFNPFLMLKFIIFYFIIELVLQLIKNKKTKIYISALSLIIVLIIVYYQFAPLKNAVSRIKQTASENDERFELMKPYFNTNNTLIISSHFRGSPFIQSAFVDAFLINGYLKSSFKEELMQRYPETYFSLNWTDDFYRWDDFLKAGDFIKPNKKILIFIGKDLGDDLQRDLKRIKDYYPDYKQNIKQLVKFNSPDEYLYELQLEKIDKTTQEE